MRKVVFDTNVYISAFITPGGKAHDAYHRAIEGDIALFTSIPILTETARKLREKFQWEDEMIAEAIRHISSIASVRKPSKRLTVLKDDPDNRILECATDAGAEVIVTGDKHLLGLLQYDAIRILTIAEFMRSMR